MATHPRDNIYSFCGLVETSSDGQVPVRISYEDDVAVIYREVALKILKEERSLNLLSRPAILSVSSVKNLPSWVPDWSTSSTSTLTYAWGHGPLLIAGSELANASQKLCFATAGDLAYMFKTTSPERALVVEGYKFDKVVEIGPVFEGVQVL